MLSFYDWYADLPVASPQIFGDQTDVPESGDWWDAGYLMMWGSNVPVTRTPDAHWMTEARYRGQKVVVVSPDYADNVKFADEWLPPRPAPTARWPWRWATSCSRSSSSTGRTRYFEDYVKQYTDLPYLVVLDEDGDGDVPRRASSSPPPTSPARPRPPRTPSSSRCSSTTGPAQPVVPERLPRPPLRRERRRPVEPRPRRRRPAAQPATTTPRDVVEVRPAALRRAPTARRCRRGVPVRRVDGHLVTTVFDLMLAQYGVGATGPAGGVADRLRRRRRTPYTPAWQESITGVPGRRPWPGSPASSRRTPPTPGAAR